VPITSTKRAYTAALNLQPSSGLLQGMIGAAPIRVTLSVGAGAIPQPGVYQILPPINDPIYGPVVLMAPAIQTTGAAAQKQAISIPQKIAISSAIQTLTGSSIRSGSVFVLGSKAIAGYNTLIVTTGFADLLRALTASGGATVNLA